MLSIYRLWIRISSTRSTLIYSTVVPFERLAKIFDLAYLFGKNFELLATQLPIADQSADCEPDTLNSLGFYFYLDIYVVFMISDNRAKQTKSRPDLVNIIFEI